VPYEQIEHTADVGLHVWAADLDELFREAASALFSVMGEANGKAERTEHVRVEAPDVEALLVDWLSELLWLFEGRDLAVAGVSVHVDEADDAWELEAEVSGPPASSFEQHGPAVKAVTYHGLSVRRAPAGWDAVAYLDI
jgi:SHS2 domain-containing protein